MGERVGVWELETGEWLPLHIRWTPVRRENGRERLCRWTHCRMF